MSEPKLNEVSEDISSAVRLRNRSEEQVYESETSDEDEIVVASHLFAELTSLDELSFPTTSSARIKVEKTIRTQSESEGMVIHS